MAIAASSSLFSFAFHTVSTYYYTIKAANLLLILNYLRAVPLAYNTAKYNKHSFLRRHGCLTYNATQANTQCQGKAETYIGAYNVLYRCNNSSVRYVCTYIPCVWPASQLGHIYPCNPPCPFRSQAVQGTAVSWWNNWKKKWEKEVPM